MGRHFLIELAYLAAGLIAVALIDATAVWAYRMGTAAIDQVAWAAAVIVVLWNIPALRAALAKDRAGRGARHG